MNYFLKKCLLRMLEDMKNDRATIRDLTNPIVRLMDNDNIMMLSLVGKEIITEEMLYGQYTKELWIDRRENSKSLAWSSVWLALNNIKEVGAVVDRPKALGDIRGVTYIYGMFYRFGLIDMPDKVNGKMKRAGRQM